MFVVYSIYTFYAIHQQMQATFGLSAIYLYIILLQFCI